MDRCYQWGQCPSSGNLSIGFLWHLRIALNTRDRCNLATQWTKRNKMPAQAGSWQESCSFITASTHSQLSFTGLILKENCTVFYTRMQLKWANGLCITTPAGQFLLYKLQAQSSWEVISFSWCSGHGKVSHWDQGANCDQIHLNQSVCGSEKVACIMSHLPPLKAVFSILQSHLPW